MPDPADAQKDNQGEDENAEDTETVPAVHRSIQVPSKNVSVFRNRAASALAAVVIIAVAAAGIHSYQTHLSQKENESHLSAWHERALAHETAGRLIGQGEENALAAYRRMLSIESNDARAIDGIQRIRRATLAKADIAQSAQEWNSAEDALTALIRAWPDEPEFAVRLQALEIARKESALSRQIAQWLEDSREFEQAGQWVSPGGANAYESLQRVLSKDPSNADALAGVLRIKTLMLQEVDIAQSTEDWERAESMLRSMMGTWPDETKLRDRLAVMEAARSESTRTDQIRTLLSEYRNFRDDEQWLEPAGANAYESLQKVLKEDPENSEALEGMAQIKATMLGEVDRAQSAGDWAQAELLLFSMLRTWPGESQLQARLGELEQAHMKAAEAKQIEQWLVDLKKYQAQGQWVEPAGSNVYEVLRHVLLKDPSNSEALAGMETLKAVLYAQLGAGTKGRRSERIGEYAEYIAGR